MTPTTRLLRFFTFLSIGLAAFCVALPGAQAQDAQGPRIAREVARRASGFGDFEASLSMTMQEGGTPRALRLRAKEADGGTHSLIIFDGPADVQGTALLSRQDGDDQQQWLWLPAARRARRIATGQLSASFLGSEFAYEDISGVSPSRYRWRHLGDGSCGEGSEASSCHRLEARPTFEGSGYDRRVVYVDTDQMRVQRVEYFTGGRHLKTLVHSDWRQHGRFWRAHRWEMTNHRTRARTIVTVGDYEFDKGFSDRDFSRGALARTR